MTLNRLSNSLFVLVLTAMSAAWWFLSISLWWFLLPVSIWIAFKVLGAIFIQWNFYFFSHTQARTNERMVALTFDDGPDEVHTPDLLKLLAEFEVPATFFVIGEKVKKNPNLLKAVHEQHHLIGNHSYSHARYFDFFNFSRMFNELIHTRELIYKILGIKTLIFRPPYGVTNPTLARVVRRLGFVSVGWSIRSLDTVKSLESTLEKLQRDTHPGGIVLLHDTTPHIVDLTRNYLSWLRENHYRVVPLNQLLNIQVYEYQ